jgi:hypothetical protein
MEGRSRVACMSSRTENTGRARVGATWTPCSATIPRVQASPSTPVTTTGERRRIIWLSGTLAVEPPRRVFEILAAEEWREQSRLKESDSGSIRRLAG